LVFIIQLWRRNKKMEEDPYTISPRQHYEAPRRGLKRPAGHLKDAATSGLKALLTTPIAVYDLAHDACRWAAVTADHYGSRIPHKPKEVLKFVAGTAIIAAGVAKALDVDVAQVYSRITENYQTLASKGQ
jgi:hypothetical protein